MKTYLDTLSRKFAIAVECGVSDVCLKGKVITGKWRKSPKVWTPASSPRSIAEELLNSTEAVSVADLPRVAAEFTKKYGPIMMPFQSGGCFQFSVSEWLSKRAELEATWRLVSAARRNAPAGGSPVKVCMDRGEYFEFSAGRLRFRTTHLDTYVSLEIAAVPKSRLRVCENRLSPSQGCKSPYFIATDLRNKYCSGTCSAAAVREAKRRWWNDNRKEQ